MAYSNYGAFVFRNGERQPNKEDVPVFGDADVEAVDSGARIWVHLLKQRSEGKLEERKPWENMHHAVLGNDRFRLCGYKSYPRLFWVEDDGNVVELDTWEYRVERDATKEAWSFSDSEGIAGEHHGFKFEAHYTDEPSGVRMRLTEPDGTGWNTHCGYCIGAGHEDF